MARMRCVKARVRWYSRVVASLIDVGKLFRRLEYHFGITLARSSRY